jgi:F0F1-type ATP synthase assembly protein I
LLIGRFIDNRFDTDPIFTIVLLVLGFVAGARETAIVIKKANREQDRNKDDAAKQQ